MLRLTEVAVTYPDRTRPVDGVSFTLGENDRIALIGENGAGKTTLLLAMVGILETADGTIELDGVKLSKQQRKFFRNRIGLVFQNPDDQLFMPLIRDDIAFGCRHAGMTEEETARRVDETLERLHITHLRERSPLKLSGGEKRLAAIGTVLAMRPSVLLFDEPTAFLDPKARQELLETLRELPHPAMIATHDLPFAAALCNRVLILRNGRIQAEGDTKLLEDEALLRDCGL